MRKPSQYLVSCGLVAAAVAGAALISSVSCAGNAEVDVALNDPEDLRAKSAYAQLAVFAGECPPDEQLAYGVLSGAIKRQTVPIDGSFASVGDMKKAKYGFAALLRRNDCAVVGFGCTPVDLQTHRHITIQLASVTPPAGACDPNKGESCVAGLCSTAVPEASPGDGPSVDGDATTDVDGGAKPECKLDLVTGGGNDFAAPGLGNASVEGPIAVATPSGFLAVYREGNANAANAIRQLIDDTGKLGAKQIDTLTPCKGDATSNGITAGWNNVAKAGLMAIASPACGEAGVVSAEFTTFDQDGKKVDSWVPSVVPYEIKFQSVSGTVPAPNDFSFLVASLLKENGSFHPNVYVVQDPSVTYAGGFPPLTDRATFTRIGSASGIVALAFDKATDAGPGAINFYVAPPNQNFTPQTYAAASSAAIAAWQDKAMLVIPTATGLTWVVRNAVGTELKTGTVTATGVSAVDVIALNDHFIVVAAQPKGMSFYRFDINGDTITAPANPIVLPTQLGSAKLDRFDGSMISVAGIRNRVIVTWLNKPGALGEGATPGGYALFQCDG